MDISERKDLERNKFRFLREKNNLLERKSVVANVRLFIESVLQKETEKYLAIYWPLRNEVDIRCLNDKYSLALPRCKKNKQLLFCSWDDKPLTKDFEGIPAPDSSNFLSFKEISLIFVPCLSVDKKFTRLGYGGGYFDILRQNKSWKDIPCIGVLTSNCVSKELLTRAEWDIPLSGIITEKEILV